MKHYTYKPNKRFGILDDFCWLRKINPYYIYAYMYVRLDFSGIITTPLIPIITYLNLLLIYRRMEKS